MAMTRARRRDGEAGAALVIVLFTLVVIALIAGMFGRSSFAGRRIVMNEAADAQAQAMLTAGLNRGLLALADPDHKRRWPADGSRHELAFAGGRILFAIADEAGKIDLNVAPTPLLVALLVASGADAADAAAIAAEIERRRADARKESAATVTRFPPLGMAPAPQGLAPLSTPAPRAFRNSVELRGVAGVTAPLYEALAPLVTVYSGKATVNATEAAAPVLRAVIGAARPDLLPKLGGDETAALNEVREIVQHLPAAGRWLTNDVGPFYTISVEAGTEDGAKASAAYVVWQSGGAWSVIERRDEAL